MRLQRGGRSLLSLIEHGVPIPQTRYVSTEKWLELFNHMKVGDSFVVGCLIQRAQNRCFMARKLGIGEFVAKEVLDRDNILRVRIWRTK
jgi:hypothetical protein